MEGLGTGIMTCLVHLFMALFLFVTIAAVSGPAADSFMSVWAFSLAFALIFYPIGGYLSGMLEHRPIPMPAFLKFSGAPAPPPPPVSGT